MSDIEHPLLFEIAFEVANKVGGIYTVLKSKTPVTAQEYGDRYCLIGPLRPSAAMEVEECIPPTAALILTLAKMRSEGVVCLFGKWLIPGSPFVLLFDIQAGQSRLAEWKTDLWQIAAVPCPDSDQEMNDTVVFGYLVAWFLGEFLASQQLVQSRPQSDLDSSDSVLGTPVVIAHFHEWLAGVALVLIRKRKINVATVFTTHATLLGRYLCAGDVDFYNKLKLFDVDAEAGKRGIYHRYCVERAAAHCADVFTTVSKITAYEAEWLLKRQPDGVLPNGLNVIKFQALHEFQNLHATSKEIIHEFVRGHFFGHYHFDLNNTLYFFTAGRYEYRNKGVDMFVEALARLNGRLKAINSNITVVAFIIMPAKNHSYTVDSLRSQATMKQLRQTVTQIQAAVGSRIFEAASRSEIPKPDQVLLDEDIVLLKGRIFASKRSELPPIVTHNMVDDANDQILNGLRRVRLFNHKEDKVKVIFHPEFLNSNSPLFGIDYEEFLRGCHLGVFPSYYEPWGYTPAECTVMGVPSITTNLSGFGCFMQEVIATPSDYGIYITDRRSKSIEDSLEQLTDCMFEFCLKTRRQRINQRNRCERLSDILDWKRMGLEYVKARWVAIRRKFPLLAAQYDAVHFDDDESSDLSANNDDLAGLGAYQKVARPISIPGSPVRPDHEEEIAHIFDPTEAVDVQDELKSLGLKGVPADFVRPI